MNWLIARMKEKSTWLALFTFASLFGMQIEPELKEQLIEAIIAVAAVLAFIFKEPADEKPDIRLVSREDRNDRIPDFYNPAHRGDSVCDQRHGAVSSRMSKPVSTDGGYSSGFNDQ